MAEIRFEWDEAKNLSNQRKHGISFEEASLVFRDPLHVVVVDRVVDGEQRWQALGLVRRGMGAFILLLVAHTVWEGRGGRLVRQKWCASFPREERPLRR